MLAKILFWIIVYILIGIIVNFIIISWESVNSNIDDDFYTAKSIINIETKNILFWPKVFIKYLVISWKNIKESD